MISWAWVRMDRGYSGSPRLLCSRGVTEEVAQVSRTALSGRNSVSRRRRSPSYGCSTGLTGRESCRGEHGPATVPAVPDREGDAVIPLTGDTPIPFQVFHPGKIPVLHLRGMPHNFVSRLTGTAPFETARRYTTAVRAESPTSVPQRSWTATVWITGSAERRSPASSSSLMISFRACFTRRPER